MPFLDKVVANWQLLHFIRLYCCSFRINCWDSDEIVIMSVLIDLKKNTFRQSCNFYVIRDGYILCQYKHY